MKAVPANRIFVFVLLVAVGFSLDIWVKKLMFPNPSVPYSDHQPDWIWQNIIGFQTSLNEGALFGLGQGFVHAFTALSFLAAAGILIWLFLGGAAKDWLLTIAMGCVTAGIFGNLYDRLGLPGLIWNGPNGPDRPHLPGEAAYAVRDYMLVMIGKWGFPNFNIADSLLVCGAILLFWHAFFCQEDPAAITPPTENAPQ
jgi:signal peptidase II